MKTALTAHYNRVHVVRKCWFDFRFVFGSFFMLVWLQKPNQNIRICGLVLVWFWFGFGLVLVWFWFGFGMVLVWFWYGLNPNQNHTKTKRIYVITYVRT